jgi:hypothetical protein
MASHAMVKLVIVAPPVMTITVSRSYRLRPDLRIFEVPLVSGDR